MNITLFPKPKKITLTDKTVSTNKLHYSIANIKPSYVPKGILSFFSKSGFERVEKDSKTPFAILITGVKKNATEKNLLKNLPAKLGKKADEYYLKISKGGIALASKTESGLLCAISTFNNIVKQSGEKEIPECEIHDWADNKMRGAMICYHSMHDFMPFFGPNMKTMSNLYLDTMFDCKLNMLLIEHETFFPSKKHPLISCKDVFAEKEIKSFNRKAKKREIEIMPLVQALGHVYYVLHNPEYTYIAEDPEIPQQYCPTNEKTVEFVKELLDEVIALHPDSKYIHVGGDECRRLGVCPRCKKFVEDFGVAELYVQFYSQICEYVSSKGKIPVMWHDIAFKHDGVLEKLPQDTVLMYWNYGEYTHGDIPSQLEKLYSIIPPERVIGASAVRCESRFGNLHRPQYCAMENAAEINRECTKAKSLGTLITDWPDSGISFLDNLFAFQFQAENSWNAIKTNQNDFEEEYASWRFGVEGSDLCVRLTALNGLVPFLEGFNAQLKSHLNRYEFKEYNFDEEIDKYLEGKIFGSNSSLAELQDRILKSNRLLEYLQKIIKTARRNKFELEYYILIAKQSVLFSTIAYNIITREARKKGNVRSAQSDTVIKEKLSECKTEWKKLKKDFYNFHLPFTYKRHLENHVKMRFKDELFRVL